jgi:hypothetical protein
MADNKVVTPVVADKVTPEPKHYVYPGDVRSPASEVSK